MPCICGTGETIGIGDRQRQLPELQQLKNARSDAKAIAAELKSVGFDVTLKTDLNQKTMKSALRDFKAQVQGGDEVVFYFSGHGVQFGGSNYLIPIDITADSEAQVADDAIPLRPLPRVGYRHPVARSRRQAR